MPDRTCVVHAGTHKTGTMTLQTFLQENVQTLAQGGMHVAQAGRVKVPYDDGTFGASPGHHDIAWELLGESREHLSALVDELRQSGCRNAIVSSEDFSLLYARPAGLEALRDALLAIGFVPKIVMYLRAQAPYAESMYVERIKHQYVRPLASFVETVVRTGHYLPEGTAQNMQFDYRALIDPFAAVFGAENVVVRAYAPNPDPAHLVRDFLGVIGPQLQVPGTVRFALSYPRENESLSFAGLLGTLHAALRPGVSLPAQAMDFIALHAPELTEAQALGRYALLQRSEYVQFLQRFAPGNRKVEIAYGAHVPFVSEDDIAPESDPLWEKARVERAIFDRCLEAWSAPPPNK